MNYRILILIFFQHILADNKGWPIFSNSIVDSSNNIKQLNVNNNSNINNFPNDNTSTNESDSNLNRSIEDKRIASKESEVFTQFGTSLKKQNLFELETEIYFGVESKLMQKQTTHKFLPTKTKPEIDPILGMIINSDVMHSIQSKRTKYLNDDRPYNINFNQPETSLMKTASLNDDVTSSVKFDLNNKNVESFSSNEHFLTTEPTLSVRKSRMNREPDDDFMLIDDDFALSSNTQPIPNKDNLEAAKTENGPKQKIQIKKGADGQDYEVVYYYYYYDDNDENNKNLSSTQIKPTVSASNKIVAKNEKNIKERNYQNKYENTESTLSTSITRDNEIVSSEQSLLKASRSSIPVTEEIDEGRLPAMTRFPPRYNKPPHITNIGHTESVLASTESESSNTSKKLHVKRPSLDLIDSETFNTDDKQTKNNRNLDNNIGRPRSSVATPKLDKEKSSNNDNNNFYDEQRDVNESGEVDIDEDNNDFDSTTPLMEKVAFDLYAILANENLNSDSMTEKSLSVLNEDLTTITPFSEEEDYGLTTTEEPTTTTTKATTMKTTTTTTKATPIITETTPLITTRKGVSLSNNARKGLADRNRIRLNKNNLSSTTVRNEASLLTESLSHKSSTERKFTKIKNRPLFGGKTRILNTTEWKPSPDDEEVIVQGTPSGIKAKSRNRFSLKGSTTIGILTAKEIESETPLENRVTSTTPRGLRQRPTLNLRNRSKSLFTTQVQTATSSSGFSKDEKIKEPISKSGNLPTRSSRFNLNRANISSTNKKLPALRTRINPKSTGPFSVIANTTQIKSDEDDNNEDEEENKKSNENLNQIHEEGAIGAENVSEAITALNRLKNRPRLNITPNINNKLKTPVQLQSNRKVNPLIARRKLQIGAISTPSTTASFEFEIDENLELVAEKDDNNRQEDGVSETTEDFETSSEPLRGLNLLLQKKRVTMRKPGTIH